MDNIPNIKRLIMESFNVIYSYNDDDSGNIFWQCGGIGDIYISELIMDAKFTVIKVVILYDEGTYVYEYSNYFKYEKDKLIKLEAYETKENEYTFDIKLDKLKDHREDNDLDPFEDISDSSDDDFNYGDYTRLDNYWRNPII